MEEASKRKRQSDPAAPTADAPTAKRQAPGAPSVTDTRAAIAAVYAAYDALHGSGASQPSEDAAAHFNVLLDAAAQGDEAVQRLAARLLPKFAPRFPAQAGAAAAALQGLASLTLSDAGATQAVHVDGVAGLRRVLLAAGPAAAEGAAESALRFALERLTHQQPNGTAHNGAAVPSEALMGVARAAFVAAPRPVLSSTLALAGAAPGSSADAGMQGAALALLQDHLLAPARAEDFNSTYSSGGGGGGSVDGKQTLLVRRLGVSKAGDLGSEDAAWAASALQDFLKKNAKRLNNTARAAAEAAVRDLVPRQPTPPAPAPTDRDQRDQRGKKGKRTPPAPGGPPPDGLTKRPRGALQQQEANARKRHSLSPSPEEGELDDGELRPSPPGAAPGAPGLPRPDGAVTLAAPCLYISGLPRGVDQRTLGGECDRHGAVTAVIMAPGGSSGGDGGSSSGGAGYVVFRSMRDAGAAYEALADQTPFRGSSGEPLRIQFCPGEPTAAGAAPPPPPPSHVWVLDVASSSEEAQLLRFLRAETGTEPVGVTPLRGRLPGALLAFSSPSAASVAEEALRRGWPPREGRRRGASPSPPPHDRAAAPPTGRAMPPPEFYTETLWVGQVPLGRDTEQEMLAAFARFGAIHSHRILNRTACAFINFMDVKGAAEARRAMDGVRIGGSTIVVEFKGEKEYWERAGRGGSRWSRGGQDRDRDRGRDRDWDRGRGGGRDRDRDYGPSPFAGAPPLPGSRGGSPARGRGGRRSRSRSRSRDRGGRGRGDPGMAAWPSANRLFSEFSEQLPPAPSAGLPPSGPPAPTGPPPGGVLWHGTLSKQRQPQAEVACLRRDPSATSTGSWAAAEPAGWPASLDVQNRIPTDYVCSTLLPAHPPGARAVLRLVPAPGRPSEGPRLSAFASYLRGKQRTGVVDLGPGPQPGAPRGRVLYLIPADEGTCRSVGVRWGPGDQEGMLAVVVPRPEGG